MLICNFSSLAFLGAEQYINSQLNLGNSTAFGRANDDSSMQSSHSFSFDNKELLWDNTQSFIQGGSPSLLYGTDSLYISEGSNFLSLGPESGAHYLRYDFGDFPLSYKGEIGKVSLSGFLKGNLNLSNLEYVIMDAGNLAGLHVDNKGGLMLMSPNINKPDNYSVKILVREKESTQKISELYITFSLVENEVDLYAEISSDLITLFEGDEFDYYITIINKGIQDAHKVIVLNELPENVSFFSSSIEWTPKASDIGTNIQNNKVIWSIPMLSAQESLRIKVIAKVESVEGNYPVKAPNRVEVLSDGFEINYEDNVYVENKRLNPFFIPSTITPNGDGKHNMFEIKGLHRFESNELVIFNTFSDVVYTGKNYDNGWDASGIGAGIYYYILTGMDQTGKSHEIKGWLQVVK